jgi:hypothetical protein
VEKLNFYFLFKGPGILPITRLKFYFLFKGPGILPVARLNFTFCLRALEYCLDVEKLNLSAIRTVRVLRPLRAINRIPSKLERRDKKYSYTLRVE